MTQKKKKEPNDPSRLSLLRVDRINYPKGSDCPVVTVTFEYEPFCCSDKHEMVNALSAVQKLIDKAKEGKNA